MMISFMYRYDLMGLPTDPFTFLSELFPTAVRYSVLFDFNLAGIIGAAFAPMIAIWLATNYSLTYVGFTHVCCNYFVVSLLVISSKKSLKK
jgi:MFS family permease